MFYYPLSQRGSPAQPAGGFRGRSHCERGYRFTVRALIPFMPHQYSPSGLKHFARELRHAMTDAERHLWVWLRRKQIEGVQFYRQRPIGNYVVDFYAPAARLVIEIDGSQHLEAKYQSYDENRTAALASRGLRVLRFDNRQVLVETRAVLEEILRVVRKRKSPLTPL